MLGNDNKAAATPSPAYTVPTQSVTGVKTAMSDHEQAGRKTPWALLALLGVYITWAMVERHNKVQDSVKPANAAINLRFIAGVTLAVVVGMNLLKILFTKLAAWKIPGAKTVLQLLGNA